MVLMREARIWRDLKQYCHVRRSHSVLIAVCPLLQDKASVRPVQHTLRTGTCPSQTIIQVPRISEFIAQMAPKPFPKAHTAFFSRAALPRVDHTTGMHSPRPRAVNTRGPSQHRMEPEVERRGLLGPRACLFWHHHIIKESDNSKLKHSLPGYCKGTLVKVEGLNMFY